MSDRIDTSSSSLLLEGQTTFPLDQDGAFIVREGRVDIFIVDVVDGELIGRRQHLQRVSAGQPVFHLGAHARSPHWGLIAVGTGDTEIQPISLTALLQRDRVRSDSVSTTIPDVVEQWVTMLTRALSQFAAEGAPTDMERLGGRLSEADEAEEDNKKSVAPDTSVGSSRPLTWVRVEEGTASFMSKDSGDELACSTGQVIPLAEDGWLHAETVCSFTTMDAEEVMASGAFWGGLDAFHQHVACRIHVAREKNRAIERDRLEHQSENRRTSLGTACQRLASVLAQDSDAAAASHVDSESHLAAATLVGNAIGVPIEASPNQDTKEYARAPLQSIARASGVHARKVALRGTWWTEDNGPLYATIEESGQPVALLAPRPGQYTLHNPATGTVTDVDRTVVDTLHPFGYSLYRPLPSRKIGVRDLLTFGFEASRRDLFVVLLMSAAAGLLSTATPVVTGMIFEDVIPGAEHGQLIQMTLALIVCAIAAAMFRLTRSFAVMRMQGKVLTSIQSAVWNRLLNLPLSFFRTYSSGDLAVRAMGFSQIQRILAGPVITSILTGVFSSFNFFLLFYYSPELALWAMLLSIIAFTVTIGGNLMQLRYERRVIDIRNTVSSTVLQFLSGITKLRVAGAEAKAFTQWADLFGERRRLQFSSRQIQNVLTVFNRVFPLFVSLTIFAFSIPLIRSQALSTGHLLAFLSALTIFLAAVAAMGSAFTQILRIVPLYENALPILEALPEVDDSTVFPGRIDGRIEMQHVSFRYHPDDPLVLDGASLSIEAGEFVALVGPSGSGKSTILNVLLGFETPDVGSVYYDNQDLEQLNLQAVRRQIGVVVQDGKLMPGDIYDNIAGASMITRDDAWKAATLAQLAEDIEAMPMGMHTVVSEGGSTLSGGQIQRLMIARAVATDPRILFFDEATSALDNHTQALISQSLENLNATRLVVAHRLSTIRNADRILVVDNGKIVEGGAYDELMEADGVFADLARRQLA
jgi:NHLM bacteriocin system ABC transporter ATP-binding protein